MTQGSSDTPSAVSTPVAGDRPGLAPAAHIRGTANSEFPISPDPYDRTDERVEAVPVATEGDAPRSGGLAAVRGAGRGPGSAGLGAGKWGLPSRGAGDPGSGARRIRGGPSGCVVAFGSRRSVGGVVTAGVDRSRASPGGQGGGFGGGVRENGTTMGGDLMGESEIAALDADVTNLAVEVAELAALMQQVAREARSFIRRSGSSTPAAFRELPSGSRG